MATAPSLFTGKDVTGSRAFSLHGPSREKTEEQRPQPLLFCNNKNKISAVYAQSKAEGSLNSKSIHKLCLLQSNQNQRDEHQLSHDARHGGKQRTGQKRAEREAGTG